MRYLLLPAAVLLMAQAPASEPSPKLKEWSFRIGYCVGWNEAIRAYEAMKSALPVVITDADVLRDTRAMLEPPKSYKDCEGWTP